MNCDSGLPFQITKSASFPGSSEPTRLSMAMAFADWLVTVERASISFTPERRSLPASQFMRVEISASSECSEVTTPASMSRRALYDVASYASSLKAPQSLHTTAATPDFLSSLAILYASTPCCSVCTRKPNSSARRTSARNSSAR